MWEAVVINASILLFIWIIETNLASKLFMTTAVLACVCYHSGMTLDSTWLRYMDVIFAYMLLPTTALYVWLVKTAPQNSPKGRFAKNIGKK